VNIRGEWLFQIAPNYFKPNDVNNIETRRELLNIERDYMQGMEKKNTREVKTIKFSS
jgi:hypothetical protein